MGYLKTLLFIFLCIVSLWGRDLTTEGQVCVLETPLFKKPSRNSLILDWVRKGDLVHLNSNLKVIKEWELEEVELKESEKREFLLTMTKRGDKAYVLKDHILALTKSNKELVDYKQGQCSQMIDPTDYRIIEDEDFKYYPFFAPIEHRASVQVFWGRNFHPGLNTSSKLLNQSPGFNQGFIATWGKAPLWDQYHRFFYGFLTQYYQANSEYLYSDFTINSDYRSLSLGPYFEWDVLEYSSFHVTLQQSLNFTLLNRYQGSIKTGSDTDQFINEGFEYFSSTLIKARYDKFTILGQTLFVSLGFNLRPPYSSGTEFEEEQFGQVKSNYERGWLLDSLIAFGIQIQE